MAKTTKTITAITPVEYSGLQDAYDHFSRELFDASLPDVFITYQRKAHSAGYFAPDRFISRVGEFGRHELALNPDGFIGKSDLQNLQTLVHEMTHVWQQAHSQPPSRGYHNAEWSEKLKSIGLYPSSTGMVGGKETGQKMSDYIIPDGRFVRSYEKLAATGWRLNLQSAPHSNPTRAPKSKVKFSCSACGQNAWGLIWRSSASIAAFRWRAKKEAAPVVAPQPYEINPLEPVSPKRGRPKGSKNKPKRAGVVALQSYDTKPRKRGRPKGPKNKPKVAA